MKRLFDQLRPVDVLQSILSKINKKYKSHYYIWPDPAFTGQFTIYVSGMRYDLWNSTPPDVNNIINLLKEEIEDEA